MKLENAIERAFHKCNLAGESRDIYGILYSYKAIRELPESEIDRIYDDMVDRLGYTSMGVNR